MHIANAQVNKVFELHLHKVYSAQFRPTDALSRPDKLTLSGRANEIQAIKSHISMLPDIRNEAIRPLQQQISKGNYQPSDFDTASAIIAGVARN